MACLMQCLFLLCLNIGTGTYCVSTTPTPTSTTEVLLLPYSYTFSSESPDLVIVSPTPFDISSTDGSGSGSGTSGDLLTTTTATTITTTDDEAMKLPSIFISLTFTNLPLEYFESDVMSRLAGAIAGILQLDSPPLILADDLLSSSIENETVINVYFFNANYNDLLMFEAMLESSEDPDWTQLKDNYELINIEVVDLMNSSSLPWWNWFIIATCCTIAITAFLLLCIGCCWRYKSYQKKKEHQKSTNLVLPNGEVTLPLKDRDEITRKISRISYNPRGKMPLLSHPLSIIELEQLVNNPVALNAEYASIPTNMASKVEVPPGAEEKNRYNDILPNAYTRVPLYLKFGVPNSDYINANYIRGYCNVAKVYIATQGPLYWTVADFWRMVWEQKCSTVVMVTGLEEKGVVKCARYWADERIMHTTSYEDLEVILKRRTANNHFTTTIFYLRHKQKMVSREVTHFWFTSWPDHGTPATTQPIIDFLLHTRKQIRDIPGPTVVHCSAGIGRSGVFIGADIGMQSLEERGEVDVLNIVSSLRQDRGGMVQTKEQYLFLHKVLLQYAHMVRSPYKDQRSTVQDPETDSANM